jgi:quercetin dioxygenase-like cupin family protein
VAILRVDEQTVEEWRPGVRTRLLASSATGAETLCLFEQWSEAGCGAPTHRHDNAEEVLVVLEGSAKVWVDGETSVFDGGGSVVVPAGAWHGFENVGDRTLHTLAAFASAAPLVSYADAPNEMLRIGVDRAAHRTAVTST